MRGRWGDRGMERGFVVGWWRLRETSVRFRLVHTDVNRSGSRVMLADRSRFLVHAAASCSHK